MARAMLLPAANIGIDFMTALFIERPRCTALPLTIDFV